MGDHTLRQWRLPLIGIALILTLLIVAWWLAAKLNAPALDSSVPSHSSKPTHAIVKVVNGQLAAEVLERQELWVLQFEVSRYDTKRMVAVTEGSVCQVMRKEQLVTSFAAPKITVRLREKVMEMTGGVTIVAVLPRLKIFVPSLRWQWQDGRLTGTGRVKLEGERISSIGDELEGDTTLQQLTLKGNVSLEWKKLAGEQG